MALAVRSYRKMGRGVFVGSALASFVLVGLLATASGACAATTASFELSGAKPTVQVPALLGLRQELVHGSTSSGYGSGGRGAPTSSSAIVITKKIDQSSPSLAKAVIEGSHWKTGSLILQNDGSNYEAICLVDPFPISIAQSGLAGSSVIPQEMVSIAYAKISFRYGAGASCSGSSVPPIESTLVRINRSASKLTARLDCLSGRCRGVFAVSLPSSACPGISKCSYTGGVRVGLSGGGVRFRDGAAFLGGVKVGAGGVGHFAMGDGGVRVVQLAVPGPLRPWLKGHRQGKIVSWIAMRGIKTAIIGRSPIDDPGSIEAAIPTFSEPETPASEPAAPSPPPPLSAQSLAISECSQPVVGTPTVVSVKGSLSPPRAATVTLTYTPLSGPPPLPSPIVDSVTTAATGDFGEDFDRHQDGADYSWEVVARIAEGDGYAATTSPPCAIPIP